MAKHSARRTCPAGLVPLDACKKLNDPNYRVFMDKAAVMEVAIL